MKQLFSIVAAIMMSLAAVSAATLDLGGTAARNSVIATSVDGALRV